jgi:hypothetical protein
VATTISTTATPENTHDYWGFWLCPSFGILKTTEQNVSETGHFSVFMLGSRYIQKQLLKLVLSRILDTGGVRKFKTPVIPFVMLHRQNASESTQILYSA